MSAILLVEDEQHLAEGLRFNLELEGYDVAIASDGEAALALLQAEPLRFDVVALDVMLPGINGFEVATTLRARGQFVPILMLTARNHPDDVLLGFEAGADDYLPKPFELRILLARLGGLLRRRAWLQQTPQQTQLVSEAPANDLNETEAPPATFTFADKTVDFTALELRTAQRTIKLTVMEADLLRFLFKYEGKPVSRKAMLEEVWGLHEDTDTRAIDNFIVRLRKYLEDDPAKPRHLLTVRGVGYRFVAAPEK